MLFDERKTFSYVWCTAHAYVYGVFSRKNVVGLYLFCAFVRQRNRANIFFTRMPCTRYFSMEDDIWVATSGDGLLHHNYTTRETHKITVESGLPSNYVNSVMYDNGYLWLGTENGLCRYNPADSTVHTYYSTLALSSASFNVNASCKLRNGELM